MTEFVTVLSLILVLALGFWIGVIFAKRIPIWEKMDSFGTLQLYSDGVDEPYLFLELHADINEVMANDQVVFDVDHTIHISR